MIGQHVSGENPVNTVLHDLYYGRISPWERLPARAAESRELDRKIEDEKRYFIQNMSLEDRRRFDELESLYTQSGDIEQVDAFSHGFRLGAQLTAAVFTGGR